MGTRVLTLSARLDATAAGPLAEALLAKRGRPLDLRVGQVERAVRQLRFKRRLARPSLSGT